LPHFFSFGFACTSMVLILFNKNQSALLIISLSWFSWMIRYGAGIAVLERKNQKSLPFAGRLRVALPAFTALRHLEMPSDESRRESSSKLES